MQKNITLIVLSVLILLSAHSTALAVAVASPTSSASPSPTPLATPTINQVADSLKERLKSALTTEADSPDSSATPSYRAFVGVIKDVIQKTIIVETKDGKRQVIVGDDTTLLRSPGNQAIKLDNVRIDDYLIAIGTIKEIDVLDGRRLITSSTAISDNTKLTGYGQITAIKGRVITLTSSDEDTPILTNDKTIIKSKDKSDLELSDLPLNSRIIYTAEKDGNDTVATVIMHVE